MQMPKPSEADKERFRSAVPENTEAEVKPMFGNLGAFVHGNMFAGLFGPTIGVKLSEADQQELEANHQTQPFGPAERPMGGYVGLPESWQDDAEQTAEWVSKAFENVAKLPPKAPKAPKAKQPKN
ncbi:TfoX/Sxy family protein [Paenarthrobacter nitroguajacolicus]|uniref:TfoX/Sxy family protein n=1 Tax=Paenarthrobacter nitroguajacolicus TaxID=211146 RepID=UPI002860469C|nr:TfoX/Sxy family protein [Paenarthrobacter nitroguajacolicus]MDR6637408.1 TfoX/Sxy family transcriptional regulator of competence genes [Paenarthrobacter nitroguajacolicus]